MGEFLQDYGFFIVVAVLMLLCHLGHGRHGHGRDDKESKAPGTGGHQH